MKRRDPCAASAMAAPPLRAPAPRLHSSETKASAELIGLGASQGSLGFRCCSISPERSELRDQSHGLGAIHGAGVSGFCAFKAMA
jgi:hypothetical protein